MIMDGGRTDIPYSSLDEAIKAVYGQELRIVRCEEAYGGDINRSFRLILSDGTDTFLKTNKIRNVNFFKTEMKGLKALRAPGVIGVPKPLAYGTDPSRRLSFLLMEYIRPKRQIRQYWEVFGRELALLHRAETIGLASEEKEICFGFREDNYIGATKQVNTPKQSWIAFFRDCRLQPQMQMAWNKLDFETKSKCGRLLQHLDSFLIEPEFPSLIHGDLWSGNAGCGPDGKAWIYDPAAYVGYFEAELAMTELFRGYPDSFYKAYHEVNPIDSGYHERRDLYNLYHMLNHLNLFGGSYLGSVRRILKKYI